MAEETDLSYAGRTLVVVFCMHRSGSSLVSNLFHRLGMSLGPFELIGASESNKYGHFEAIPFCTLNRELQAEVFGFPDEMPLSAEVFDRFCSDEGQWPSRRGHSAAGHRTGDRPGAATGGFGAHLGIQGPAHRAVLALLEPVLVAFSRLADCAGVSCPLAARDRHQRLHAEQGRIGLSSRPGRNGRPLPADGGRFGQLRRTHAVVRFDRGTLADDLRQAAAACTSFWSEEVFAQVYDAGCRHHESAPLTHPAEGLFRRLSRLPPVADAPEGLKRLERDAAAGGASPPLPSPAGPASPTGRWHGRAVAPAIRAMPPRGERCRRIESEHITQIMDLDRRLTLIRGSRTWRWRGRLASLRR